MKNVQITNPLKVIILTLLIIGSFVYIIVAMFVDNAPDTTSAWALLSGAAMYILGNGSGARQGIPTLAPFTPTIDKAIEHLEHMKEDKNTVGD